MTYLTSSFLPPGHAARYSPERMRDGLEGRRILLGVSGSIAAYKAAELARILMRRGAEVQVVLTAGGARFVAPLTFGALTAKPVITDVFALGAKLESPSMIEHVERAHAIDLLVVAPASANTIARLACGLADDALSAIALATRAPILIAPAMEPGMWQNAATRENVARLVARGTAFVGPEEGELASGRSGVGRMSEPELIADACGRLLSPRDLDGVGVLVTAGPTWEAIDPVRVLSNRSTGAMGMEIARAAALRGGRVTLVLGPTSLPVPSDRGLSVVRVESALEMLAACEAVVDAGGVQVMIAGAAVSDFRPAAPRGSKLKRSAADASTLTLVENPDVLATIASKMRATSSVPVVVVGFAAETENAEAHAREKLAKKKCDVVIANVVGRSVGFGGGETEVLAVFADVSRGVKRFGPAGKAAVAQFVLDQVIEVEEQLGPR